MRGGEGLTFCKNCKITIRIFERKNQKNARIGRRRPCSALYLGCAPLKGEGAKTVTRLSNACHPLLIKGDAH
jgi:hypothetical protein